MKKIQIYAWDAVVWTWLKITRTIIYHLYTYFLIGVCLFIILRHLIAKPLHVGNNIPQIEKKFEQRTVCYQV